MDGEREERRSAGGAEGISRAGHAPVLPGEVMGALALRAGETALDCTAGLGGHALEMARALGPGGTLILNDADAGNLAEAERRVRAGFAGSEQELPTLLAQRGNYADAPRRLAERGLRADAVLADLGFSSNQVEDAARGLSFSREGPLDMRFDPEGKLTAREVVNTWSEEELREVIAEYGEDRNAGRIARGIVRAREAGAIETTGRLAEVVRAAHGPVRGERIDAATRTFQALRIVVNDEVGSLASLLESVERGAAGAARGSWLRPGARIAVIAFHSLEDRPVKRVFEALAERGIGEDTPRGVKQPVRATEEEARANPRSRSAKLRAVRLTAGAGNGASAGERPKG